MFKRCIAMAICCIACAGSWAQSSTVIECTVPSMFARGVMDVMVINPDLSTGLLSDGFSVSATPGNTHPVASGSPYIERVEPAYGLPGTRVRITGSGFSEGGTTQVKFGVYAATNVVVLSGPAPDDYYGAAPPAPKGEKLAPKTAALGAHILASSNPVEDGQWVRLSLVSDVPCDDCEIRWNVARDAKASEALTEKLNLSGTNRPVLSISPATISDSGSYTVSYNDGSGWKETPPFNLKVVKANSLPLQWWPVALVLGVAALCMAGPRKKTS